MHVKIKMKNGSKVESDKMLFVTADDDYIFISTENEPRGYEINMDEIKLIVITEK